MKTYIIGHIKPDLDSVVAAISFSDYVRLNGVENPTPAVIDDINEETKFVFKKFGLTPPAKISLTDITNEDKIILVDHNEESQRLPGLNQDQIIVIFDHHKPNINFTSPIEICIMPFGSSNTVAWQLYNEISFKISKDMASLMLCAVLSDTVGLKSPTTTDKDREAVEFLAKIANIADINALAFEIFRAKSNINSLTDEQIVLNDYKVFDFSGKKVLIGQIETVEQKELLANRQSSLLLACNTVKTSEKVDFLFLAVTDILGVNTKLLLPGVGESDLAVKAFGGIPANSVLDIGAKLSRKKEIAPPIETALKS